MLKLLHPFLPNIQLMSLYIFLNKYLKQNSMNDQLLTIFLSAIKFYISDTSISEKKIKKNIFLYLYFFNLHFLFYHIPFFRM